MVQNTYTQITISNQSHYEKFAKLLLSIHRLKNRLVPADIIEFTKLVLSIARRYCVETVLYTNTRNKEHDLYCSFGNERGIRIYFKIVGVRKGDKVMIKRVIITDMIKLFEWKEDEEWAKREYEDQFVKTENAEKLENELKNKLLNVKLPKDRKEVRRYIKNVVNEVLNKLGGCQYATGELRKVNVLVSRELINGAREISIAIICGYSSFEATIKAVHSIITDIDVKEDTYFDPHCYLFGDLDEECLE